MWNQAEWDLGTLPHYWRSRENESVFFLLQDLLLLLFLLSILPQGSELFLSITKIRKKPDRDDERSLSCCDEHYIVFCAAAVHRSFLKVQKSFLGFEVNWGLLSSRPTPNMIRFSVKQHFQMVFKFSPPPTAACLPACIQIFDHLLDHLLPKFPVCGFPALTQNLQRYNN